MDFVERVLRDAGVWYEGFGKTSDMIWITEALQLISTYEALEKFRNSPKKFTLNAPKEMNSGWYAGWEVHHVVEANHLAQLGVASKFPAYEKQLCVLIPERGHRARLNTVFRAHHGFVVKDVSELLPMYRSAYEVLGAYTGADERLVKRELIEIVETILRRA